MYLERRDRPGRVHRPQEAWIDLAEMRKGPLAEPKRARPAGMIPGRRFGHGLHGVGGDARGARGNAVGAVRAAPR